ncbi:chorismate-binding protein [Catalinimonas niigatensis]|uniref:chorismate-binding protein n=1 Tax=Catalinimonas niigatensis TaxID=1397264 RepID=UPI0026659178|nr:chorismate-binding protein [Catalinimonas niigatensis]WPP51062.1 chorismate-binding protein [Catalinimonas niigatensis]
MEEAINKVQSSCVKTKDIHALFLETAQKYHYPVAAWSLPFDDTQHIIMDISGEVKQVEIDLENMSPGFMVSPFGNDYGKEEALANYIYADLHYDSRTENIHVSANKNRELGNAESLKEELIHRLQEGLYLDHPLYFTNNVSSDNQEMSHDDFVKLIDLAKEQITQQRFKKVVPSRCQYVQLPENFNLAATFQRMCDMYPHAFVSAIALPGLGSWLGASPEILVKTFMQNGNRIFKTMALAGTQKLDETAGIKNAAWRGKEIEEQAMVSRYIINCFKKIRLREFDEDGPHTVAAGNLLHLCTDLTVNMDQVNFPELGSVMLKLLHPTSAVCGLPKEPALEFIQENEHYDRALFAGFLGPVNINEQVNIFVNLRCMQLVGKRALIYAGAGVTADSDAEKEWQETSLKMQTLQKVLF